MKYAPYLPVMCGLRRNTAYLPCGGKRMENSNNNDKLKYEVMTELGLFEKVRKYGWKSLSAKETGKIGGLVTRRKKLLENKGREA